MPGDKNNVVGKSFDQDPTNESKSSQSSSLVSVLGMNLPDIGEQAVDISKQFQAMIATSRMQMDYEMAANLVEVILKNKEAENYIEMLIIALLNQAELFGYKKEINKQYSFDKDERGVKLWQEIKQIIQTNKSNLENIPIENIFKKTYSELLANYAISSKSLHIIGDCMVFLKNNFAEEISSNNIIYTLEEHFMKNSIENSNKEISSIFVDKIASSYDFSHPMEIDSDPEYTFHKAISSLTEEYVVNPEFSSEYLNNISRKQIHKYFMIRNTLEDLPSKLKKQTGKDDSELEEIFLDGENSKKSASIFSSILEGNNISEKEIQDILLKELKEIVMQEEQTEED